ncbi:MAG: low temperature requirement protein A [Acidimicrobiia bacterium]
MADHRPPDDLRVSPLELFFDLVFVFAVTQVSVLIRQDASAGAVLRGLLILAMLWWAWQQYTWTINGVGTTRLSARLVLVVAMGATLLTAMAVPDAFGDSGLRFAAGYAAVLLLALAFYWIAIRDLEGLRAAFMTYLPLATMAAAIFLIGGLVDPPLRTVLWVAGIAIELVAAANANQADFQIRPGHFAERHQLFVILALGESIVAIGLAAATEERTLEVGLAMGAAFVATAAIWWAYFDRIADATETALGRATGPERTRAANFLFTSGHFPLIAGIVLFAVVAEEAVAHPSDHLEVSARVILVLGFALVLGTLVGIGRLSGLPVLWERLVAVGAIVVLALAGAGLVGWLLLGVSATFVVLALIVERQRLVWEPA